MISALKNLDMYGVKPELYFKGKKKFKTCFGLVATVVTVCLTGVFGFLFGSEFFFRSNPIVISQEMIAESSPRITPTSLNFPMFFNGSVGGAITWELEKQGLNIFFSYGYYQRDANNDLKNVFNSSVKPKRCSETKAVDNPSMQKFELDQLLCLDWEELGETFQAKMNKPITFGGVVEEDEFAILRLQIGNCIYDYDTKKTSDCKPYSTFVDNLRKRGTSIVVYYPSFFLDVDSLDDPIKTDYETKSYNLNPTIDRKERRIFEISTFEDDTGWIFKDVKHYSALKENVLQTEMSFNFEPESDEDYLTYFAVFNYIGRKTTLLRRRFMKIQELFALVGGFIKAISMGFQACVGLYAGFQMDIMCFRHIEAEPGQNNNSSILKNTFVSSNESRIRIKPRNKPSMTFKQYFMGLLGWRKHADSNKAVFTVLVERLDITNFLNLQTKEKSKNFLTNRKPANNLNK